MVNLDPIGLSHPKLWWNEAGQEMAYQLAGIGNRMGIKVAGVDPSLVGRGDNQSFDKLGIPTLMVHSVTQEKLKILHSSQDNLAAIDMSHYRDTYRLLVACLEYLDANPNQMNPR